MDALRIHGIGARLPPSSGPARPLVMVTASGSPSAMLVKVEPMVASRGATPRGTAWSSATVTVRPSAPKSLRSLRFRPRPAVVPVGLMSNAGVKVVVIWVLLLVLWDGKRDEPVNSGPGVDADAHVSAGTGEVESLFGTVER